MKSKYFAIVLSITAVGMFAAGPAPAALSFLKVGTINGESNNANHVGWSDILGYNIGVQNSGCDVVGGGGCTSQASFSPMHIQKLVDSASPLFLRGVVMGTFYPTATIDVVRTAADTVPFVRWDFEDVLITSYNTGWSTNVPVEAISLDYRRIRYTYRPQLPGGGLGEPVEFGWDRQTGKAWTTGSGSSTDFEFITNFASASAPEPNALALISCGLSVLMLRCRTNRRVVRPLNHLPGTRAWT